MKSWAEMGSAGRGGVVAVVGAVIAALFYGAWTASRPPAVEEAAVTATGTQAEPEIGAQGANETSPAAEPAPEPDLTAAEPKEEEASAATEVPAPGAADETAPETGDAEAAAEAETAPLAEDSAAPEAAPATEEVAEAAPAEPAATEAPAPTPPSFDLVRVEKDGSALVAGSAAPGATVSLRVTGSELAAVPADGQGKFVAMFNLAPSAAPRVLSMSMALADGTVVPSEATVVIGPTVAPAVVAEVAEADTVVDDAVALAEAEVTSAEPAAEPVAEPLVEAPAALLVTEDGAKVLQSAAEVSPELVANVTIDTITYTNVGDVQLSGRGTAERVVRLYLDNAQVAETPIGATGDWAVTLPEVAPGVYVLRADQLDATGKVTSRFETPFKRETVEALAAASGAAETSAEETQAASAQTGQTETAATDGDTSSTEAATAAEGEPTAVGSTSVTVQPGFTLWRIATENLGDGIRYIQVFEANKDQIRDPDLIYPGQVFTIPAAE